MGDRERRVEAVLWAITEYTDNWGEPPTQEEVADLSGIPYGSIPGYVRTLRERGDLAPGKGPGRYRSLVLATTEPEEREGTA